MQDVTIRNNTIHRQHAHESHRVEAWGQDSIRVRITLNAEFDDDIPGVLLPSDAGDPQVTESDELVTLRNGKIQVDMDIMGRLTFRNAETGEVLCEESEFKLPARPNLARRYRDLGGGQVAATLEMKANPGERFFGMGEHTDGLLDLKGCKLDLHHHNTTFNVPFAVSNRGYGFLWHSAACGTVEFAANRTEWSAAKTRQIDYWVTAGDSYADILERYSEATGKPPMMPEWAAGLWQCKLRYKTSEEVLEAARGYKQRGLPIDIIVIDYYHWEHMGDWKVEEKYFPDLKALCDELADMGIRVMMSIHPTVTQKSENYYPMMAGGMLVRNAGKPGVMHRMQKDHGDDTELTPTGLWDPTHPEARKYVWDCVKNNYYDKGIRIFWLDAAEPGGNPDPGYDTMRFHAGDGEAVVNLYPNLYAKAFYDGMKACGEEDVVLLARAGYAGIQRYGAAVWSGDIYATFEVFRQQIVAGLNVSMSGIPWWNTDIGGFNKCLDDETHNELLVRWYQYGVFTPIFRLHGNSYDTEIWTYPEPHCAIMREFLELRYRLRPYILDQMRLAHERGTPPMRPLFFDYPEDPSTYDITDAFLFGPDILVAPVTKMRTRARDVYLPAGPDWQDAWTGEHHDGGQTVSVEAPLERIPLFLRSNSGLADIIRG